MADTSHLHAPAAKTEADGVNYRGIAWFIVVLVGTTITCQVLMWALFGFLEKRTANDDLARAPLASPMETPTVKDGHVVPGTPIPAPNLMVNEPLGLQDFRRSEDASLTTYGWVDQNGGTVRIPIEEAKKLLLQRGIPGGTVVAATPATPAATTAKIKK